MKVSFLMFFISQWKTLSRDQKGNAYGRGGVITSQWRCLFTLAVVTLVAYRHDVRRESLTFWLFQNYVKSDLISNNMKMSGDMRN